MIINLEIKVRSINNYLGSVSNNNVSCKFFLELTEYVTVETGKRD